MTMTCCIPGCKSRRKKGIKIYMAGFPKKNRETWISSILSSNCTLPSEWQPGPNAVVCELHFTDAMWEKERVDGTRKLKVSAFPNKFFELERIHVPNNEKDSNASEIIQVTNQSQQPKACVSMESELVIDSDTAEATEPAIDSDIDGNDLNSSGVSLPECHATENIDTTGSFSYERRIKELEMQLANTETKLANTETKLSKATRILRITSKRNLKERSGYLKQRRENFILKKQLGQLSSATNKLLSNDQLLAMTKKSTRGVHWSNDTIKKALRLKFSCGTSGYNELLAQDYPLPSERTLRRKLESIDFEEGICEGAFEQLREAAKLFDDDRCMDAVLALDEMSLKPSLELDPSSKKYCGLSSFRTSKGNSDALATHGLIFVLSGIFSRWKYTVAYYFTPDSMLGQDLKPIVEEILERAEEISIRVHLVASDMGSVNGAMWSAFGVCIAGRYSEIVNSIPHPCDPFRKLWFCPDSGHLFKNLKWALLSNKSIDLPEWFVNHYHLSSSTVRCQHISELAEFQEGSDLLMAPKITLNELNLGNFAKMKVNKAVNFLSSVTSSSLIFLADEDPARIEYRTTAIFIEVISKWFKLVTSRNHTFALGYTSDNEYSLFQYEEAILFLQEVAQLFHDIKIGSKGAFKPVQRGVILTTKTVLELADWLIENNSYKFVLTGHFTTDCVENMFSCIRAKQPIPTPLQFKQNLKIVTVSKYLRPVNNSSYNADGCVLVGDFLKSPKSKSAPALTFEIPDFSSVRIVLDTSQLNILYYDAGYIFSRMRKNNSVCRRCLSSAGSIHEIPNSHYTKLTKLRRFTEGTLFFVHEEVFEFFKQMEIIFRQNIGYIRNIQLQGFDAVQFFKVKMNDVPCDRLKTCHGIKQKAIARFVTFRLRIAKQTFKAHKKNYSSKSMAMHTTVS